MTISNIFGNHWSKNIIQGRFNQNNNDLTNIERFNLFIHIIVIILDILIKATLIFISLWRLFHTTLYLSLYNPYITMWTPNIGIYDHSHAWIIIGMAISTPISSVLETMMRIHDKGIIRILDLFPMGNTFNLASSADDDNNDVIISDNYGLKVFFDLYVTLILLMSFIVYYGVSLDMFLSTFQHIHYITKQESYNNWSLNNDYHKTTYRILFPSSWYESSHKMYNKTEFENRLGLSYDDNKKISDYCNNPYNFFNSWDNLKNISLLNINFNNNNTDIDNNNPCILKLPKDLDIYKLNNITNIQYKTNGCRECLYISNLIRPSFLSRKKGLKKICSQSSINDNNNVTYINEWDTYSMRIIPKLYGDDNQIKKQIKYYFESISSTSYKQGNNNIYESGYSSFLIGSSLYIFIILICFSLMCLGSMFRVIEGLIIGS